VIGSRLLLYDFLVFLLWNGLFGWFFGEGVDFKEDISNGTSLIFAVVYLLYCAVLRRCYLGELFVRLNIGKLLKFLNFVSLLHVQLLHLALLDLLPKVGQGKA
jgi:hypothetical protein